MSKIFGGQEYESNEFAFMNAKNYYVNLLPMCKKEHIKVTYTINDEDWSETNQSNKWVRNLTETCYREDMCWKNLSFKEKVCVALSPMFVAGVAGKLIYRHVKGEFE